jgi:uncharacterized protein
VETKRQNDIIAFKLDKNNPVAFHARNLEVAEISEELWDVLDQDQNLLSENNPELAKLLQDWNEELNPEVRTEKATAGIRSLTINVTQICNLQCTYCAAGGDGTYGSAQLKISTEKTIPQLKYFLDQLSANEKFKILFLGGEPLLYPEGIQALGKYVQNYIATDEKARNLQAHFAIVTNGTLLNQQNIEILKNLKSQVTVSLDGPPQVNDLVRPMKNNKSSTEAAVAGLKLLLENRSDLGSIIIHGVFHQGNMNLVEAYNFYLNFPADKYEFTLNVENLSQENSLHFAQQMHLIADQAYSNLGEAGLRKIGFFDNIFTALDEQLRTENYCGAGKSFLVIDAKNKLFTCPWDVSQKNEAVGEDLKINTAALDKYAAPLIEQNSCQTCWARYLCGGGCMFTHKNETGSKNIKSKQFCNRMQSLLATSIIFYKKCRNSQEGDSHEKDKTH